jgi:hypothetical protein
VATDGPVNTPIAIGSLQQAQILFGTTPAPTGYVQYAALAKSLTVRAFELLNAGCTDIRLCRVGGTTASTTITDASGNALTITANYPGAKYNGLLATAYGANSTGAVLYNGGQQCLVITTIDGVKHVFPATGILYGDLELLIQQSNVNVSVSGPSQSTSIVWAASATYNAAGSFSGGTDGTSPSDSVYSAQLANCYSLIEQYPVDIVVPCGAYLQPTYGLDASGNITVVNSNTGDTVFYGQNLAQFCARLSVGTHSTFGVLAVAPLVNPTYSAVVTRANQLNGVLNASGTAYITPPTAYTWNLQTGYAPSTGALPGNLLDQSGNPVNIQYLMNVVAGPDILVNNPNFGNYVIDGAVVYAGRAASLSPYVSTTNAPIGGVLALAYQFGASVQNALVGNNLTCFALRNTTNSVVTVSDTTYAANGSDFANLSTLRTVYAVMESVRNGLQAYIGQPNNPPTINAMGTQIARILGNWSNVGAIIDGSYQIFASSAQQISGNMTVMLALTPALEIKQIQVPITLSPPANVSLAGTANTSTN